MKTKFKLLFVLVAAAGLLLFEAGPATAHCDTMDGPVINDAKTALSKNDVTPVLKWVDKDHEREVRSAFLKASSVRGSTPEARELADTYFFETLVRVHRAGEGAPYTGLKPAGSDVDPTVKLADKALDTGSVDELIKKITDEVAAGIRARFNETKEKKQHADHNVEAGREFVKSYVEYVHYVERLHQAAVRKAAHGDEPVEHAHDAH